MLVWDIAMILVKLFGVLILVFLIRAIQVHFRVQA